MTSPIYIRLSFLIEDVEENMGPTALLPGTHGTHVNSPPWFTTPDRQPRQVPEMVLASGKAGDCLINDTSIYHTNTPNLSDKVRKIIWALYTGSRTPIWGRKELPEDYRDKTRLTRTDVGASDDPVMAALFRSLPED